MAYEKQVWEKGQVIMSEMLNHIEDGISAIDKVVASECHISTTTYHLPNDVSTAEFNQALVDALESKP